MHVNFHYFNVEEAFPPFCLNVMLIPASPFVVIPSRDYEAKSWEGAGRKGS